MSISKKENVTQGIHKYLKKIRKFIGKSQMLVQTIPPLTSTSSGKTNSNTDKT